MFFACEVRCIATPTLATNLSTLHNYCNASSSINRQQMTITKMDIPKKNILNEIQEQEREEEQEEQEQEEQEGEGEEEEAEKEEVVAFIEYIYSYSELLIYLDEDLIMSANSQIFVATPLHTLVLV